MATAPAPGHVQLNISKAAYVTDDSARASKNADKCLTEDVLDGFVPNGIPLAALRSCSAEHNNGTDLPRCFKVYLPVVYPAGPTRPWRLIVLLVKDQPGPDFLAYLAFGPHHAPSTYKKDVYEVAHFRLHGAWPGASSFVPPERL